MPRGDGTGPMGAGPMTGRSAGFCAGYDMPGYANPAPGFGRGFGGGFGRGFGGRGFRNRFWATGLTGRQRMATGPVGPAPQPQPTDEVQALRTQAENLEQALRDVRRRLDELQPAAD